MADIRTEYPKWMNRKMAAQYISYSPGTLAVWASKKLYLKYYKMGRSVRYDRDDLDRFIQGGREPETT